jgi:hypothetical protein
MCTEYMPGQSWAELSLSSLSQIFLGVKSADKPGNVNTEEQGSSRFCGSCHSRVARSGKLSDTPTAMCLVPATCDPCFLGCRVIECNDFCSEPELQLLK